MLSSTSCICFRCKSKFRVILRNCKGHELCDECTGKEYEEQKTKNFEGYRNKFTLEQRIEKIEDCLYNKSRTGGTGFGGIVKRWKE